MTDAERVSVETLIANAQLLFLNHVREFRETNARNHVMTAAQPASDPIARLSDDQLAFAFDAALIELVVTHKEMSEELRQLRLYGRRVVLAERTPLCKRCAQLIGERPDREPYTGAIAQVGDVCKQCGATVRALVRELCCGVIVGEHMAVLGDAMLPRMQTGEDRGVSRLRR